MSLVTKLRRGKGRFWATAKRAARTALSFHLPVNRVTRPFWRTMHAFHVSVRESWIWGRRFFWNEPLFRSQCRAVGTSFQMEELPYLTGHGRIMIGDGVTLSGKSGLTFNNKHLAAPLLTIGDGSFLGHQCSIRVGKRVKIGRNCLIAGSVTIADYDGHPLDANARRVGETSAAEDIRPVTICDDVWLAAGCTILKGVTVGARSIVAARAVVTKDVPEDCVVAGNPARVVKHLVSGDGRYDPSDVTSASVEVVYAS